MYTTYKGIFTSLTNRVVSILRKTRASRTDTTHIGADQMDRLARIMASHIDEHGGVNAMEPIGASIINDFLLNKNYVDLYFAWIVEH